MKIIIHIEHLVKGVLAFFPQNSHTIQLRIPEGFLLENILINLVDNAIKYADDSRKLELSTGAIIDNKELNVSIKDNGIGVNTFMNLTEPFFSRNKRKRRVDLCLALTVSMPEQLDGRLTWANNTNGEGTEFQIHIPV